MCATRKLFEHVFVTSKPDQATSKTSDSVVNKLEKAPKPTNNIIAKPTPIPVPICLKSIGKKIAVPDQL